MTGFDARHAALPARHAVALLKGQLSHRRDAKSFAARAAKLGRFDDGISTKEPHAQGVGLFGRDDRSRTCLTLLPKQVGNRYPTSRSPIHYSNPRGDCQAGRLLLRGRAVEFRRDGGEQGDPGGDSRGDQQAADRDPMVARKGCRGDRRLVALVPIEGVGFLILASDLVEQRVLHLRQILSFRA